MVLHEKEKIYFRPASNSLFRRLFILYAVPNEVMTSIVQYSTIAVKIKSGLAHIKGSNYSNKEVQNS